MAAETRIPIELRVDSERGRGLYALDPVPAGRTIISNDAFAVAPGRGTCNTCFESTETGTRCSACSTSYYCTRACQRKDWLSGHKEICAGLRRVIAESHGKPATQTVQLAASCCRRLQSVAEPASKRITHPLFGQLLDSRAIEALTSPAAVLALDSHKEQHAAENTEKYAAMSMIVGKILTNGQLPPSSSSAPGRTSTDTNSNDPPPHNSAAASPLSGRQTQQPFVFGQKNARTAVAGTISGAVSGLDEAVSLHADRTASATQAAAQQHQDLIAQIISNSPLLPPNQLMDLFCRIGCNVFTICDGELRPKGIGLYMLGALLCHSCSPNCLALYQGTRQIIRTIRPVSKGEEFTISYVDISMPAPLRIKELREGYYFTCKCSRCSTFAWYERVLYGDRVLSPSEVKNINAINRKKELQDRLAAEQKAREEADREEYLRNHERELLRHLLDEASEMVHKLETPREQGGGLGMKILSDAEKEELRIQAEMREKEEEEKKIEDALRPDVLQASPFSAEDVSLMGVRCTRVSCNNGTHVLLPPAARKAYGVPQLTSVLTLPETVQEFEWQHEKASPSTAARAMRSQSGVGPGSQVHSEAQHAEPVLSPRPNPCITATACSGCGAFLSAEDTDAALAVQARAAKLVQLQKNGGQPQVVAAAGPALMREMDARLSRLHFQKTALANALVNAFVSLQEWERAASINETAMAGFDESYPAGHPLPALQHALQGKLLHYLRRPGAAIKHLRIALQLLAVSHGASDTNTGGSLLPELSGLMQQCEVEFRMNVDAGVHEPSSPLVSGAEEAAGLRTPATSSEAAAAATRSPSGSAATATMVSPGSRAIAVPEVDAAQKMAAKMLLQSLAL